MTLTVHRPASEGHSRARLRPGISLDDALEELCHRLQGGSDVQTPAKDSSASPKAPVPVSSPSQSVLTATASSLLRSDSCPGGLGSPLGQFAGFSALSPKRRQSLTWIQKEELRRNGMKKDQLRQIQSTLQGRNSPVMRSPVGFTSLGRSHLMAWTSDAESPSGNTEPQTDSPVANPADADARRSRRGSKESVAASTAEPEGQGGAGASLRGGSKESVASSKRRPSSKESAASNRKTTSKERSGASSPVKAGVEEEEDAMASRQVKRRLKTIGAPLGGLGGAKPSMPHRDKPHRQVSIASCQEEEVEGEKLQRTIRRAATTQGFDSDNSSDEIEEPPESVAARMLPRRQSASSIGSTSRRSSRTLTLDGKVKQRSEAMLARELSLPFSVLKESLDIFKRLCSGYDGTNLFEVSLDMRDFHKVLCHMCDVPNLSDLDGEFIEAAFRNADRDASQDIDVEEFASWYASFSFSENIALPQESRDHRNMARKLGIDIIDVDRYKRAFDKYDVDRSGAIDQEEFGKLLYDLLKVPSGHVLPQERIVGLWREADADGSGEMDFEEFCDFYNRRLDGMGDGEGFSFSDFYRSVRRVPTIH
eukprot:gb/GFBE01056127.1/.p1 GENE.gb/GFBE01056127.1/~~gb/GFBE01056127.1/.p1  ORF type:complete len:593 (+),score=92.28 gb/GFBE01056127.1/:1-1779(+)